MATLLVGVSLALGMLYFYPPWAYPFYPQCPVWALLHVRCPGCGSTRAVAALLHGDIAGALRWNALTILAIPSSLLWLAAIRVRTAEERAARAFRPSPTAIAAGLVLVAGFTLLRNL